MEFRGNSSNLGQREYKMKHMENCIDYLRQGSMCAGDMSLEPQDGQASQAKRRVEESVVYTCRDWDQIIQWQKLHSVT